LVYFFVGDSITTTTTTTIQAFISMWQPRSWFLVWV